LLELKKTTIYTTFISGHSSVVERLVANEKVEGSTPFARSIKFMSDLTEKKCVPCEGGVSAFDISEIQKYQKKVDGWDIIKNEKNIYFLEKKFSFKNFLTSQEFVNQVGKISEEEGHHPDILFGWGYAKVSITTHAIEGLSENDFILAAKIDKNINV
tara:strand:+ start:2702 stop:3172 length:471 start_codon:yes stop_codon:yes gene_type:complete